MIKIQNIFLIEFLRTLIRDNLAIESFRVNDTDFTRCRKLPFWRTTVLILRSWKASLHNKLNKFFEDLDLLDVMPTSSAFCQARKKIKPELFIYLRNEIVNFFFTNYPKSGLIKRWKGRLLWAIDGSRLNIPDTKETREKYSILGYYRYSRGAGNSNCVRMETCYTQLILFLSNYRLPCLEVSE